MPPNILFIMADQFRADALEMTGGYAKTPNLARLARHGLHFPNTFANSVECIPSRLSLATGLDPHQFGLDRNASVTLSATFPNWMQALENAGYVTSVFGKTHLHEHTGDLRDRRHLMQGLGLRVVNETAGPRSLAVVKCDLTDLWEDRDLMEAYRADLRDRFATKPWLARPSPLPLDLYYDSYVGRVAREYLEGLSGEAPWFCWVSFGGPHEPWDTPARYADRYRPEDMPEALQAADLGVGYGGLLAAALASPVYRPDFGPGDVAALRANYAAGVTLIDDEIGALLEVLERRPDGENTLVIFTSDHGEMNGDYGLIYKANFMDQALKVPLIVVAPHSPVLTDRRESHALVELMDVGATVLDYAGIAPLASSAGRSLRPAIEGGSAHRDFIVSEFGGFVCAVSDTLKVEFAADLEPVFAAVRSGDMGPERNVCADPAYSAGIAQLQAAVAQRRTETPRIHGVLVGDTAS
jgi:choline-sulfatase